MALTPTGGGYGRNKSRYRPMAEINVTPMVDVMLVLLVIFMVTAPMMTSGVNIDLPKTSAAPVNTDSKPLTISVDGQGQIFLQEEKLELGDLVERLKAISDGNNDRRILVRADKDLAYGKIMQLMATVQQGGFTKVALLSDQSASSAAAPAAPRASGAPAVPRAPARPAGR
jgi:biopolymer transport protein TolR